MVKQTGRFDRFDVKEQSNPFRGIGSIEERRFDFRYDDPVWISWKLLPRYRTRFDIPRTHLLEASGKMGERNFRNLPIRPMGIDRPRIWRISQLSGSSSFAGTRESWKIEQHAANFQPVPENFASGRIMKIPLRSLFSA